MQEINAFSRLEEARHWMLRVPGIRFQDR